MLELKISVVDDTPRLYFAFFLDGLAMAPS